MTSLHPSERDSGTNDSVTSSPRSEHHLDQHLTRVRFMCSFGGKILPRPHDNQLRYVGGETRMVAVHRSTTFSPLLSKLSKLAGTINVGVKYQLPNEDLDALISVTTDEDVANMMEEYDRLAQNQNPRSARLRLFLFNKGEDSQASSISSLLDGSTNREHWFFDAINNGDAPGLGLERGPSEASSIISEVPDYLFGLDNSEEAQPREPKSKTRFFLNDNVSMSDPSSPGPGVSSPFYSTSSAPIVPSMLDLPPVKTKPDIPPPVVELKQSGQPDSLSETVETRAVQQTGYQGQPMWHYVHDARYSSPAPAVQQLPVYYVPGTVHPGNDPVQPVPIRAQYVQQYSVSGGQIPAGYHQPVGTSSGQVYGGAVRPVIAVDRTYDPTVRVVPADGMNQVNQQQVYYGVRNAGLVEGYPGMMVPGREELPRSGSDVTSGRISQSSR